MKYNKNPITFSSGSQKIAGTLYIPDVERENFPGIVINHGRGSSQQRYLDRAKVLAGAGFLTLVFDFRGCGESEGDFSKQTAAKGYQDALASYDFLTEQNMVDSDRIGVYGGSYGGYLAALITQERKVKSLILSAPAIYKDEWWDTTPEEHSERYEYMKATKVEPNKALQAISEYDGNLLVIRHERDEVISQQVVEAYYNQAKNAFQKQLKVLKNAPHPLHDKSLRQESNRLTVEWFRNTL